MVEVIYNILGLVILFYITWLFYYAIKNELLLDTIGAFVFIAFGMIVFRLLI
ncbi:positive regulator of sigma E activity [Bacillus pakistanensis]|uniref:Positive regulator of sigma E activity n=1 Tax=Rossellomorea pakistanensis TaxID=992288 RepID=A0ABS2ND90_9BACI|nr:positive regulator of sigma E activity [Bacillus pakistanensis]